MSMVTRIGTYMARPTSWTIGETKASKCPQLVMIFKCDQYKTPQGFEPVEGEESITGYFTLINKDGQPNEINIRNLRDALGWDGSSFANLEGGDWAQKEVQIVVEDEPGQDGKTYKRVRYINPRDYVGFSLDKASPQVIQSLDQKYGAALRAVAKKDGAKPQANPPTATPARSMVPASAEGEKQRAWQAFCTKAADLPAEERTAVFRTIVSDSVPGKEVAALSAADWKTIQARIEKDYDTASRGLIPF